MRRRGILRTVVLPAALLALLVTPAAASAGQFLRKDDDGTRYIRYRYPLEIKPGQNDIGFEPGIKERPSVDGYITYFKPELRWVKNGKIPPVDVIHLHHAVWLHNGRPTFAAGEEKTIASAPKGYGWEAKTTDNWLLNHMIHNLTPDVDKVWVEWTIGFIPKTSAAAKGIRAIKTQWMDVQPGIYPVSTSTRARAARTGASPTPTTSRTPTRGAGAGPGTSGSSTVTRRSSAPPATCIRAACGRTST